MRVVVVTADAVGPNMAGPAIRAWNFCDVLAKTNEVRLVSTGVADRDSPSFAVYAADPDAMTEHRVWADVVVAPPGPLRTHPVLREDNGPLVVDIYDPFHLENLAPGMEPDSHRTQTVEHLNSVMNEALTRGDYFLCATERQRDFWLGSLTALGRLNPATYDRDPTYRSLLGVVPFGIPSTPPERRRRVLRGVVPGIGEDDRILLWGGGVYNWFDPLTLVDAVEDVRSRLPSLRLVFLGMNHPNDAIPEMRATVDLRRRTEELGLEGRHVFFNEGWTPYDERGDYLLEADAGVTTHHLHIETAFSFRTRVLDYLWASLPFITSDGDVFADVARDEGVGLAVPVEDPSALAAAIETLLGDDTRRRECRGRAAAIAPGFHWERVLEPLVAFCAAPTVAPDRIGVARQQSETLRPRGWRRRFGS